MVERIKITPNRIICKDSSGATTFDTDNKYVKNQSGGSFKLSGTVETPMLGFLSDYYTPSHPTPYPFTNVSGFSMDVMDFNRDSSGNINFIIPTFPYAFSDVTNLNSGGTIGAYANFYTSNTALISGIPFGTNRLSGQKPFTYGADSEMDPNLSPRLISTWEPRYNGNKMQVTLTYNTTSLGTYDVQYYYWERNQIPPPAYDFFPFASRAYLVNAAQNFTVSGTTLEDGGTLYGRVNYSFFNSAYCLTRTSASLNSGTPAHSAGTTVSFPTNISSSSALAARVRPTSIVYRHGSVAASMTPKTVSLGVTP